MYTTYILLLIYTLQCAHHQKHFHHLSPYSWHPLSTYPTLILPLSFWYPLLCSLYLHVYFCLVSSFIFCLVLYSTYGVKPYRIFLSLSHLFHLASYTQGPSMLGFCFDFIVLKRKKKNHLLIFSMLNCCNGE